MPFQLVDARVHLQNEEESYDDALIIALVKASGEIAENKTNRAFMQSTWLWTGENFPEVDCNGFFKLMPGPLVSVTSIKYYPADGGAQQTIDAEDYEVDSRSVPGRVRFVSGFDFPDLDDRFDAVEIVYVVGYGASGANEAAQQSALPPDVVSWMKLQLGNLYKHRETIVEGKSIAHLNTFVDNLIYPYLL
jgi:uncharacterized phiE125 gp8 family phage protein